MSTGRRLPLPLVVALGAGLVVLSALGTRWWRQWTDEPVTIILISIDTCRADHLGLAGMKLVDGTSPTPVIDQLGRDGHWWPFATTPVPLTLPAHTSMMSGLYPDRHGVRENDSFKVPKRESRHFTLLAEEMKALGFDTAAFVSAQPLERRFGLDAGFRIYDQPDRATAKGGGQTFRERPCQITAAKAADYLAQTEGKVAKRFVFIHFFDPHIPYERRFENPALPQGSKGDYLSEIMAVDATIGAMLDTMPDKGRNAWVIVTGDHGEGLGDHGEPTHGFLLYESTLRVPLVIRPPRGAHGGLEFDAGAKDGTPSILDVTPTLLEIAAPGRSDSARRRLEGVPWFRHPKSIATRESGASGAAVTDRAETLYAYYQFRHARLRACRNGPLKLIEGGGRAELFDTVSDGGESHDLATSRQSDVDALRKQLLAILAGSGPADSAQSVFDSADVSGPYIGGRTPGSATEPTEEENAKLPHVLSKWDLVRDLETARAHLRRGDPGKAVLTLKPHAAERSGNPALLLWSGRALREVAQDQTLAPDARLAELSEAAVCFRELATTFKDVRGTEAEILVLRDRQRITGSAKDLEEMVRLASGAIAGQATTPLLLALRGIAKAGLGDLQGAESDLAEAATRDPEDLRIAQDLRDVRRRLGR